MGTVKFKVTTNDMNTIVFSSSRKISGIKSQDISADTLSKLQDMINKFLDSKFKQGIAYEYWMMTEGLESAKNITGLPRTRFQKFLHKHTEPPRGWPWINIQLMGINIAKIDPAFWKSMK